MSGNDVEVVGRLGRWWCEGKGGDGRGFGFSHVDSEAALCTRTQTENFDWLTSLRNHIPLFSKLFAVNIVHTKLCQDHGQYLTIITMLCCEQIGKCSAVFANKKNDASVGELTATVDERESPKIL